MTQTNDLLLALQGVLKSRGITYRQLAKKINVSETTVKRMFSRKNIDLKRLQEICNFLDLNFFDLAKIAANNSGETDCLTLQQEQTLAENAQLFNLFCLLAKGTSLVHVKNLFSFGDTELRQHLKTLERAQLIERHPGDEVRILVNRHFRCIKNGPVHVAYFRDLKNDFMNSEFDGSHDSIILTTFLLPKKEFLNLERRIESLIRDIRALDSLSARSTGGKKESFLNMTLMTAYRPWLFSPILKMKSDPEKAR